MHTGKGLKRKALIALGAAAIMGTTLYAQSSSNGDQYLKIIADNTTAILKIVNDFPAYLQNLSTFALAWTQEDKSDTTATMQANFANLNNAFTQNTTTINDKQAQLNADLLGNPAPQSLPYANDLVYSTLLNRPFFSPDPRNPAGKKPTTDPAYNFFKNATGINITHQSPDQPNWTGRPNDQKLYSNYYTGIMAAQSFNAYLLSDVYANYLNGNKLTDLQNTLINQAGSSDWFAKVASESIGSVLRQILMYESQVFILMTHLLDVEKQLLASQGVTNTLLVLMNQSTESTLVQKASKVTPQT